MSRTKAPSLASHLRMAVARLARQMRQEGAQDDASPSQLAALATLYNSPPMTIGELASIERVKPPTMTRIVANLEERGLVERSHGPDGRMVYLVVTDAGRAAHEQYRKRRDAWLDHKLAKLPKEDRDIVARAADIFERWVEE